MLDSHKLYLYDRIKETSYTLGTSDFVLNGAANGFSSFGSEYSDGETLFYAATDGSYYEVGSGVYVTGVQNSLKRYPFKSTNIDNSIINFGEGLKEIFATYPATNSVYTASGLQNHQAPEESGIAFWSSSNIINYDPNIVWDSANSRIGIKNSAPSFAIDIGGDGPESIIRSSGYYAGSSGVIFPSGNNGLSSYLGGTQLSHYEPNLIDDISGLDHIVELSGNARNIFVLQKQSAGLVFAGPPSGCAPPCSPDYPTFRPILVEDILDLDASNSIDNEILVYDSGTDRWEANNGIKFDDTQLLLSCTGNNTMQNHGFQVNCDQSVGDFRSNSFYDGADPPRVIFRRTNGSQSNKTVLSSGDGLFAIRGETINTSGDIVILGGLRMEIDKDTSPTEDIPGAKIFLRTSSGGSNVLDKTMTLYSNGLLENQGPIRADAANFTDLNIRQSSTPASSSDVGVSGDIKWDNSYIYVCVSDNTWKRAYLTTW